MRERQIKMKVLDEFNREPDLDATKINVSTEQDNIVLKGRVSTNYEKELAGKAAERISENHSVMNEIIVDPLHMRSDAEIGTACERKLSLKTNIPANQITIEVDNGWVTLKGQVDSEQQKKIAQQAVKEVSGVTGVTNKVSSGS